jgi:hypothetical protein
MLPLVNSLSPLGRRPHGQPFGGGGPFGGHATLANGLISVYRFEETSGVRSPEPGYDYWGDLTDVNTLGSTSGIDGNAANSVKGNAEHLTAASVAGRITDGGDGSGFTFCQWLNLTTATFTANTLISGVTNYIWIACDALTGPITLSGGCRLPGWNTNHAKATVSDGTWALVLERQIVDGSNSVVESWVNGVKIHSYGPHAFYGSALENTGGSFGGAGGTSSTNNQSCLHDELLHWNRSLTDGEISDLWASGTGLFYGD